MSNAKILILMVRHGAAHERVAAALRRALLQTHPGVRAEVVDVMECCARWFRAYYNSYEIPLKYSPGLWGWIESVQHTSTNTSPRWLYRRGVRPLCRIFQEFDPDIVVATEVGLCELAAIARRDMHADFCLIAAPVGTDIDRAWAQPEVNLYVVAPGEIAAQLEAMGAPADKILPCGTPIDPSFASAPDRITARERLNVRNDLPLVLVLFGGTGFGSPHRIVPELRKVRVPLQTVFITGKNPLLEKEVKELCAESQEFRVLGWVENMHEWMVAADLLVSKPGAATILEALACGLPFLAFDPLPGCERRACLWLEKRQVGYWIKSAAELSATIERLLSRREELKTLRSQALELGRPRAAYDAAHGVMNFWRAHSQVSSPTNADNS